MGKINIFLKDINGDSKKLNVPLEMTAGLLIEEARKQLGLGNGSTVQLVFAGKNLADERYNGTSLENLGISEGSSLVYVYRINGGL